MTHHAATPRRRHRAKAPQTLGRLALWLTFAFLMACMILGMVVNLVQGGPTP